MSADAIPCLMPALQVPTMTTLAASLHADDYNMCLLASLRNLTSLSLTDPGGHVATPGALGALPCWPPLTHLKFDSCRWVAGSLAATVATGVV